MRPHGSSQDPVTEKTRQKGDKMKKVVFFAEARDSTTGTLRERGPDRVSREDAESDADELRARWVLATKVRVHEVLEPEMEDECR